MIVETVVSSNEHDLILKGHRKSRTTFEDACVVSGLVELLDDVKVKCEDERTRLGAPPTEKKHDV